MCVMDKRLKVVLIDPWGVGSTGEYLNGLISGLSSNVNLTVFTNKFFKERTPYSCEIYKIFFSLSEKMASGVPRKILRGIEYLFSYIRISFFLIKHRDIDVVHINWLLFYKFDKWFLRWAKRKKLGIVYTAHNVLPHINGESKVGELAEIYTICDAIILHGEKIKKEFGQYYSKQIHKVYVQKHGCNLEALRTYDIEKVPKEIVSKIEAADRIFLYIGRIFYNKGVDRLVEAWTKVNTDDLLVIAGSISENYPQLVQMENRIKESKNILYLNYFISDNVANYLLDKCDLIVLPYRHASMSGVVFTAADFGKPIFTTNVGAIPEYLAQDDFIVKNTDISLTEKLMEIIEGETPQTLKSRGIKHSACIKENCDWSVICSGIVENVYLRITND